MHVDNPLIKVRRIGNVLTLYRYWIRNMDNVDEMEKIDKNTGEFISKYIRLDKAFGLAAGDDVVTFHVVSLDEYKLSESHYLSVGSIDRILEMFREVHGDYLEEKLEVYDLLDAKRKESPRECKLPVVVNHKYRLAVPLYRVLTRRGIDNIESLKMYFNKRESYRCGLLAIKLKKEDIGVGLCLLPVS
ncbi:MAG: hypothetical protein GXO26_07905 [Crenarchaeota archaeon]|nr:hypothetical protein [Thermoproteota archaeon]